MGQHLASFRELFRMEGERLNSEAYAEDSRRASINMVVRDDFESSDNENGNDSRERLDEIVTNNETGSKDNGNLDNDQLDLSLDNRNLKFESIYSQPLDTQEVRPVCSNGNFIGPNVEYREEEGACCSSSGSSNSSSSSEDSPANPTLRRTTKTLSFVKHKGKQRNKEQNPVCNHVVSSKKKRSNWVLKFNCAKSKSSKNNDIPEQPNNSTECVCTGYRRTEEHPMGAGIVFNNRPVASPPPIGPVIDLERFNPAEFSMEVRSLSSLAI